MTNTFRWSNTVAPMSISAFSVTTASKIRQYSDFFRTTLCQLADTPQLDGSWSRYLGVYGRESRKFEDYFEFYQKLQTTLRQFTDSQRKHSPRGSIDSPIVICGIAPGWTKQINNEAFWLFGPASKTLSLGISDTEGSLTNVLKTSFEKSQYCDVEAER